MNTRVFRPASAGAAILALFLISPAWAVNITIDPGGYVGLWRIPGQTGDMYGMQTVDIPANASYALNIATSGVNFDVDAAGNVSSSDTDSVSASGSTITLLNATINVDPVAFPGESYPRFAGDPLTGPHSRVLVPGLSYQFRIATGAITLSPEARCPRRRSPADAARRRG